MNPTDNQAAANQAARKAADERARATNRAADEAADAVNKAKDDAARLTNRAADQIARAATKSLDEPSSLQTERQRWPEMSFLCTRLLASLSWSLDRHTKPEAIFYAEQRLVKKRELNCWRKMRMMSGLRKVEMSGFLSGRGPYGNGANHFEPTRTASLASTV